MHDGRLVLVDVARQRRARVLVDDGADVGRQQLRIADDELVHRAAAACAGSSSAVCSGRHSMRSAEQRWPALLNADVSASRTTCSGSAELSTIIALTPPVSAISVASGPSRAASAAVDRARSLDGARERDAGDARVARAALRPSARPSPGRNCSAPAGCRLARATRTARAATSVPCSAGFAMHGVAGRERRRDLPREDREREIPRAHADEHAAADELELRCARRSGPAAPSAPRARAAPRAA